MKQQDARIVKVGENTFYIRPLPALRAANLSGELAALAVPLLSGLAPILAAADAKGKRSEGSLRSCCSVQTTRVFSRSSEADLVKLSRG